MTRSPMRARSRMAQFAAGVCSAVLLFVVLAGIPFVLLRLGAGLLPHHVPTFPAVRDALLHNDVSGSLFMQVIVVIGWVAWASFALSLMVELIARFRRHSTIRIPGMRTQQRWAAALIAAITLMFVSPAIANAASVIGHRPPSAVAMASRTASPFSQSPSPTQSPSSISKSLSAQNGSGRVAADSSTKPVDAPPTLTYEVRRGDYLGSIAQRFDGSFDEYHRLAEVNHIADPSHIEAGWKLRLPSDAVDHGVRAHAAGTVAGGSQATPPPTAPPAGSQTPSPAAPGHGAVPPTAGPSANPATAAPTAVPSSVARSAPVPSNGRSTSHAPNAAGPNGALGGSSHPGNVVVEMLEASGTLAAVVTLSMLAISRREQLQRRLVRHIPAPASGGTMPRLMAPTRQRDMIRVDSSLRSLAALVDGWPIERIPQIAGVWVDNGTVTLMLADDCGAAPRPFTDDPNGWTLAPEAALAPHAEQLAPLPTLVTVGGRAEQHLLLDIEYLRVLGIGGDRTEAMNLLRFIAAELTHNVWSDDVRVVIAGFGDDDATALAAIDTDRVRVQASVAEAVVRFRRRVARAVANWDAPPGPPEVLLIARPSLDECEDLTALERDLMRAPGIGMAVVIGGTPEGFEASRYQVRVGADGLLRVGFLGDAVMPAASLPDVLVSEVAALVADARKDGNTSPLDLARAASLALLRTASGSPAPSSTGASSGASTVRRTASLAGQHRRPPGQKPEPREAFVDLMKPRHVRSA